MKDWNVYVDFHVAMEEGTSLFRARTICSVYVPELEDAIVVGEASIYLFDPRKSSYEDVCGEAAILSSDLSRVVTNLGNFCVLGDITGFIAVVQSFQIYEEWSSNGLEEAFFTKLLEQFTFLNVELVTFSTEKMPIGSLKQYIDTWDNTYIEYENGFPVWFKFLSRIKAQ